MLNFISVRPDILSGIRLFLYPRLPCPIYRVHFRYENDRDTHQKGTIACTFMIKVRAMVQKKEVFRLPFQGAQSDSNRRHSEPQSDALTN